MDANEYAKDIAGRMEASIDEIKKLYCESIAAVPSDVADELREAKAEVVRLKAGLRECIVIAESYNKRDGRLDAIEELL